MTNIEFAEAAKNIANNYETIYVAGCYGSPMDCVNRYRFTSNHPYNSMKERSALIKSKRSNTFGFDSVGLIKGILWGWSGNSQSTYGGARYAVNGVPDMTASSLFNRCNNINNDQEIQIGEIVEFAGEQYPGIYTGEDTIISSIPGFGGDGVIVLDVKQENGRLNVYERKDNRRIGCVIKHGKLSYVDYLKIDESRGTV